MSSSQPMLVVQSRFQISGRGLMVMPWVQWAGEQAATVKVELRKPDGASLRATASIEPTALSGPNVVRQAGFLVVLQELTEEQVPVGTELWLTDAAAQG